MKMKMIGAMLAISVACCSGCQHQAPVLSTTSQATNSSTPARVSAARLFIRVVANADVTEKFYQRLGFEGGGMPLDADGRRPYIDNPAIEQMYDAPGQVRFVTCKPLAVGPSLLLLEFKAMSKQPVRPNANDIGANIASITVRDLTPILRRLAEDGVPLLSNNGQPTAVSNHPEITRIAYVRDPDGSLVELVETPRAAPVADNSNLLALHPVVVIKDTKANSGFYQRIFGVAVNQFGRAIDSARMQAAGLSVQATQRSTLTFPGSNYELEFLQLDQPSKRQLNLTAQSVGTAIVRMVVTDFDAMLAAFKQERATILSRGGVPLVMGTSDIFLSRDPNGFLLEPSKPRDNQSSTTPTAVPVK